MGTQRRYRIVDGPGKGDIKLMLFHRPSLNASYRKFTLLHPAELQPSKAVWVTVTGLEAEDRRSETFMIKGEVERLEEIEGDGGRTEIDSSYKHVRMVFNTRTREGGLDFCEKPMKFKWD